VKKSLKRYLIERLVRGFVPLVILLKNEKNEIMSGEEITLNILLIIKEFIKKGL